MLRVRKQIKELKLTVNCRMIAWKWSHSFHERLTKLSTFVMSKQLCNEVGQQAARQISRKADDLTISKIFRQLKKQIDR